MFVILINVIRDQLITQVKYVQVKNYINLILMIKYIKLLQRK